MSLPCFIHRMTGWIYKSVPLYDPAECAYSEDDICAYMQGLAMELLGALDYYPILSHEPGYGVVVNTMLFLSKHPLPFPEHKRAVFNILHWMNVLEKKAGEMDV